MEKQSEGKSMKSLEMEREIHIDMLVADSRWTVDSTEKKEKKSQINTQYTIEC